MREETRKKILKECCNTALRWDEDVELNYFNARWYDPETGGFITEDPIRSGMLWYAYASNNPMRFIDPTGLMTDDHRDQYAELEANGATQEELDEARANFEQQEREFIDMHLFALGVSNISEEERARLQSTAIEYMGYYNRDIVPDSVQDYGGENLTGRFEEKGEYLKTGQDPHPAIDFTGGDGVETPWYTIYEGSSPQKSNPFMLSIPGTDYRARVKHSDKKDVDALNKQLKADGFLAFTPGETISPYPTQGNPSDYDPHFHVEIRTTDSMAMSPLVNPIGLEMGRYKDYLYDYGGTKGVAPMDYGW